MSNNPKPGFEHIGVADIPWKPTHVHIKSGGEYRWLLEGIIEADMTPCIIYDNRDGVVWVRPKAEFEDGRFAAIVEDDNATD